MKTQALNTDKVLIESVKLILEDKIVKKKPRKTWTLFKIGIYSMTLHKTTV